MVKASPQLRRRKGETPGQKWVDNNHDLKCDLIESSDNQMPFTPAFTTSDYPFSSEWSEETPPAILFYIQVPPSTESGLKILPKRISVDIPGWQIEAFRRLDQSITYQALVDRMTTDLGQASSLTKHQVRIPTKNSLQNHTRRNCRNCLHTFTDYHRRADPHRVEVEALEYLSSNNLKYNTVLDKIVVPGTTIERLNKVRFVRKSEGAFMTTEKLKVTRDNYEETTYPLDYFNKEFSGTFALSESVREAIQLLHTLQERAIKHGMEPSEWRKLSRSCLPASWYDRTTVKTKPNDTYDGACETCTWKGPGDYPDGFGVTEPGLDLESTPSPASTTKQLSVKKDSSSRISRKRKRVSLPEYDTDEAWLDQSNASSSIPLFSGGFDSIGLEDIVWNNSTQTAEPRMLLSESRRKRRLAQPRASSFIQHAAGNTSQIGPVINQMDYSTMPAQHSNLSTYSQNLLPQSDSYNMSSYDDRYFLGQMQSSQHAAAPEMVPQSDVFSNTYPAFPPLPELSPARPEIDLNTEAYLPQSGMHTLHDFSQIGDPAIEIGEGLSMPMFTNDLVPSADVPIAASETNILENSAFTALLQYLCEKNFENNLQDGPQHITPDSDAAQHRLDYDGLPSPNWLLGMHPQSTMMPDAFAPVPSNLSTEQPVTK